MKSRKRRRGRKRSRRGWEEEKEEGKEEEEAFLLDSAYQWRNLSAKGSTRNQSWAIQVSVRSPLVKSESYVLQKACFICITFK